ncbi:Ribosomal protein L3 plastid isoform 1 [Hibiscus syriacus]|uniref:Ribosomal protein L3 plastid isoform 1 n=1 Tax=Hibiscus syriacus TaxID=106335 RepID=A0A6A3CU32_HIBSY|nr:uncharacterized protein LOC120158746 [Hibiscus syriacus]KAE8730982.1 Ribosomal protein L3 plastid isoform 1 [Hibiscus syriacus]
MKRDQLSECGGCGTPERFFLHNLRHRASYRRLCTNCILKNHQGLFCPICLEVFNEPPPPHQRLICVKCPSVSHFSCSCSSSSSLSQSFTCPPCSNPNFSFFNLTNKKPKSTPDHPGGSTPEDDDNDNNPSAKTRVMDKETAKALLAAAKIAAVSMTKAATVAKTEAERRVKEATLAKKRAKEGLERLALLARKDIDRHKSSLLSTPKSRVDAAAKTSSLSLPSHIPEKGNNGGSYSVSAANVPKLQLQHSTHGIPN